jgi:hypothetical protein
MNYRTRFLVQYYRQHLIAVFLHAFKNLPSSFISSVRPSFQARQFPIFPGRDDPDRSSLILNPPGPKFRSSGRKTQNRLRLVRIPRRFPAP